MGLITLWKPLDEPRKLPVREDIEVKTMPSVKIVGGLVLISVIVFYIIFW
jgi:SSS family solute:Na+ symporter